MSLKLAVRTTVPLQKIVEDGVINIDKNFISLGESSGKYSDDDGLIYSITFYNLMKNDPDNLLRYLILTYGFTFMSYDETLHNSDLTDDDWLEYTNGIIVSTS